MSELARLPGIGRRTALRLAMHILRMEPGDVGSMTSAIDAFRSQIKHCRLCNNLSDADLCPICQDPSRDGSLICVVEQVGDVISIENTRQYRGRYHVLGGVISPMQGIGPSSLKIDLLLDRLASSEVREVILAIGTTLEGETTLLYLKRQLERFPGVQISSLARGIGFGDELEYADELTIAHALENRRKL